MKEYGILKIVRFHTGQVTRQRHGDIPVTWVIRLKAEHGTVVTHTGSEMLCRCQHRLVVGRIAPTVVVAGVVAFYSA